MCINKADKQNLLNSNINHITNYNLKLKLGKGRVVVEAGIGLLMNLMEGLIKDEKRELLLD